MRAPIDERLKAYHTKAPSGCWVWTRYIDKRGYGQVLVNGKKREAYRVAYETFVGPVPEGLELDHLCRNRACINPAHLEPVTRQVNVLRGVSCMAVHARKTTCKFGHPFRAVVEQGRSRRRCVVCQTAAVARYQKRVRVAKRSVG